MFQGVQAMRESSTYQPILEEDGIEVMKRIILRLARERFGEPDEATRAAMWAIADLPRLERLGGHLVDVTSWQELLQTS
jgi:hypothetical protein